MRARRGPRSRHTRVRFNLRVAKHLGTLHDERAVQPPVAVHEMEEAVQLALHWDDGWGLVEIIVGALRKQMVHSHEREPIPRYHEEAVARQFIAHCIQLKAHIVIARLQPVKYRRLVHLVRAPFGKHVRPSQMLTILNGPEPLGPPGGPIGSDIRAVKIEASAEVSNGPICAEEGLAVGQCVCVQPRQSEALRQSAIKSVGHVLALTTSTLPHVRAVVPLHK